MSSTAQRRLSQVKDFLTSTRTATTIPFDPNCTNFPTRKNLPEIQNAPPGAAWVWGENDYVSQLTSPGVCRGADTGSRSDGSIS